MAQPAFSLASILVPPKHKDEYKKSGSVMCWTTPVATAKNNLIEILNLAEKFTEAAKNEHEHKENDALILLLFKVSKDILMTINASLKYQKAAHSVKNTINNQWCEKRITLGKAQSWGEFRIKSKNQN